MSDQNDPQSQPLALPPPTAESNLESNAIDVAKGGDTWKFDHLGPLVVNSNGTLSRIANWESMTEDERIRTTRVLLARNRIRLAEQEANDNTMHASS